MTVTSLSARHPVFVTVGEARSEFEGGRGYLAAAAMGLPSRASVAAQQHDLNLWSQARRSPLDYGPIVESTRANYATLAGVTADRVAIGSQTSALVSVIATAVPAGAEVLCVDGDFSSIVFPFLQRPDVRVRHVALHELAEAITDNTWLVVFSHVQSATGVVADTVGITAAAARRGAFTLCDTTQSTGVHPVDAAQFSATVCHSYKWLASPRGAAFLTLNAEFQKHLVPVQAGWYAGSDVWASCYGPEMTLARDARAFDVSPAWPAWVGAQPALELFAGLDISAVWSHAAGLGDALCDALGIEQQHQAIVTWADADGADLAKLAAADIRASARSGRLRAAFHLWNDLDDVADVAKALR
ncbi:MAG: aminotransferase class V-fold PLP-dependent enzyme [Microbacteriaceae bacterium]|nr:aminotransferase class V-fold PLP-dependent enzyme [Microbacteriaceae bacterium]